MSLTTFALDCAPGEWDEQSRLAALRDFHILDTARSAGFDQIVEWAVDLFEAPIAVVNFIGADRQWFKAEIGIGADELPLDVSICRHAILQRGVFVIPDLRLDARFEQNPLVHADEGLRFYAGALLETPAGLPLGTVCVLDHRPRPDGITKAQRRDLARLARQAMTLLDSHLAEYRARKQARELDALIESLPLGIAYFDRQHRYLRLNRTGGD